MGNITRVAGNVVLSVILLGVLAAVVLPACSGQTVTSPYSGKPVNDVQLAMEKSRADAQARAELEAKAAEAAATARRIRLEAETEADAITVKAQTDAAEANRAIRALQARSGVALEDVTSGLEAFRVSWQQASVARDEQYDAANAEIQRKRDQMLGIGKFLTQIPIVGQGLAAAGVSPDQTNGLLSLLLGGGSAYMLTRGRKKEADTAYDQGVADATAAAERTRVASDQAWDQAQLHLLQMLANPTALQAHLNKAAPAQPVEG